jgi:hypothetical protein
VVEYADEATVDGEYERPLVAGAVGHECRLVVAQACV